MMNQLKKYVAFVLVLALGIGIACAQQVKVKWSFSQDYDPANNRVLQIILSNAGDKPINLSTFDLWFNSMYPIEELPDQPYHFHNRNGNLYSVDFKDGTELKKNDSLILSYRSPYPISHKSLTPNGFYLQSRNQEAKIINIGHPELVFPKWTAQEQNDALAATFARNSILDNGKPQMILPSPVSLKPLSGNLKFAKIWSVYLDPQINKRSVEGINASLRDFKGIAGLKGKKDAADLSIIIDHSLGKEAYQLKIGSKAITIRAGADAGAFYALQTLKSLATADQLAGKRELSFPCLEIQDEPRFAYRGFMMDIARNFKDLEVLKKYVDVISYLKINKFHLHFIDDEGWRLQIPSLPELTEVGSNRSALFDDGKSIQPAYGSGPQATKNAYLTTEQFKELLMYAAERHVTIIPEIETPGHARASIKAMESRYHRLLNAGKKKEAEEFLLYEAADQSVYSSAQYWDDNVMNPALPSVYHFLDVVLTDIQKMYQEVGLSLDLISLGGDEVPAGSWEKSPLIAELMQKEGMQSVYEVWPYYVKKIHAICAAKGIKMAGWEEFGMINKGNGMVVNDQLSDLDIHLDVWNNVIGGGQEDLAYRLANAGYPTIFTSCANYYLDMVWDQDFREPGLKWASITDLYQAYAMLPSAFFANIKFTNAGKNLSDEYLEKKVRLTSEGEANLKGIKAALWAETVLTPEHMDYMLFPRLYALAERAWAPKRNWESEETFDKATFDQTYKAFATKVGQQELPKLENLSGGFHYRLPAVGANAEKGTLHVNTEYPGFTIRYTLDGTDPNSKSKILTSGTLQLKNGMVVKMAVVDAKGRVGRIATYTR